jgi:hypothetical protein
LSDERPQLQGSITPGHDGAVPKPEGAKVAAKREKFVRGREVGMAHTLESLRRIETERGYSAGWADRVWELKQGRA